MPTAAASTQPAMPTPVLQGFASMLIDSDSGDGFFVMQPCAEGYIFETPNNTPDRTRPVTPNGPKATRTRGCRRDLMHVFSDPMGDWDIIPPSVEAPQQAPPSGLRPLTKEFLDTMCSNILLDVRGQLDQVPDLARNEGGFVGPMDFFINKDDAIITHIVVSIQHGDLCANKERTIVLDSIHVNEQYRRQGICTAILRAFTHGLNYPPYNIRAVKLTPTSEAMFSVLGKLGCSVPESGIAVVWNNHLARE